jgi:hypothetical protein
MLLGDADGHRDAAAVSAAAFGPGKFPLVHKVCMGVTAAMCGKLRRSLSAWHASLTVFCSALCSFLGIWIYIGFA